MTSSDLDKWTVTALADGEESEPRLPNLRTERLGKNVKVRPETKALLAELGARLGIGPAGIAGRLIEELAAQGNLRQTWRAACNRRRKALYRLRREDPRLNNRCGCGADCQDRDDCRYIFDPEANRVEAES